jgi:hypothetical protein
MNKIHTCIFCGSHRRAEILYEGVSINQSINYLLTVQLTQLEMINSLEFKLSQKSLPELKTEVSAILDGIPSQKVPDWDLR